jgi:hypothetical protein
MKIIEIVAENNQGKIFYRAICGEKEAIAFLDFKNPFTTEKTGFLILLN